MKPFHVLLGRVELVVQWVRLVPHDLRFQHVPTAARLLEHRRVDVHRRV